MIDHDTLTEPEPMVYEEGQQVLDWMLSEHPRFESCAMCGTAFGAHDTCCPVCGASAGAED